MARVKTTLNRRSFLKATAMAGGGLMLSFNWLAACKTPSGDEMLDMPDEWFYVMCSMKIGCCVVVTLLSPNSDFGWNVLTSMHMILADELDVDWKKVIVEQADFYPERFDRQFTGGSTGILLGWKPLRTAGATARQMLVNAAAQQWDVPAAEITTDAGVLYHKASGKNAGYGEMASLAAGLPVPEEVAMKSTRDFKIIGTSRKNVDGKKIVTGEPLFTIDHKVDGMLIAMVIHPPFGMTVKSFDDSAARSMPGIRDVFTMKILPDDYERNAFDTVSFPEVVVVVGNTTWEVMNAKKAVKVEWELVPERTFEVQAWGGRQTVVMPKGLESTTAHRTRMEEAARGEAQVLRRDGNPEAAFRRAAKVLERT